MKPIHDNGPGVAPSDGPNRWGDETFRHTVEGVSREAALTDDEIYQRESVNAVSRERYLRALVAERLLSGKAHDPDTAAELLAIMEHPTLSFHGCCADDAERFHRDGVAKMYSAQEISEAKILYLYERGDDQYRVVEYQLKDETAEASRDYTREALEALVAKHFDHAASPIEIVTRGREDVKELQRMAQWMSDGDLVGRLSELRRKQIKLMPKLSDPFSDLLTGDGIPRRSVLQALVSSRVQAAEMSILITALSKRYDGILERAAPEVLRSVLVDNWERILTQSTEGAGGVLHSFNSWVKRRIASFMASRVQLASGDDIRTEKWPAFAESFRQELGGALQARVTAQHGPGVTDDVARAILSHLLVEAQERLARASLEG